VCCPSRASTWSGRQIHHIPHTQIGPNTNLKVGGAWNNHEVRRAQLSRFVRGIQKTWRRERCCIPAQLLLKRKRFFLFVLWFSVHYSNSILSLPSKAIPLRLRNALLIVRATAHRLSRI
jgi:hypothetical protein